MDEPKDPSLDSPPQIDGDSRFRWFLRGAMVGILLMASTNALSYFVRSRYWQVIGLSGPTKERHKESLGFPYEMWEKGNTYGGYYIDYPTLGANILVAVAIGCLIGWIVSWKSESLNDMVASLRSHTGESTKHQQRVQFSLRGLMITTAVVAVTATLAKNFAAHRETLVGIYLAGPTCLVAIAMLPRGLSWQTRVKIMVPLSLGLIAAAVAVGIAIGIEFDKVLLGIFLCWTPQSAIAAISISAWVLYRISVEPTKVTSEVEAAGTT